MAKRVSRQSTDQKLYGKWWVQLILAAVSLGIAYGFASLAIDNGSLLTYAVAIAFIVWGIIQLKRGAGQLLSR